MGTMLSAAAKKTSGGDACLASSTNVTGTRASSQLMDGLRLTVLLFNPEQGPRESGLMPSDHGRGLPMSPIQTAILDRLADVRNADLPCPSQIGNRPSQLEHSVIGPGGKTEPGDRGPEQALDWLRQATIPANVPRGHVRIREEAGLLPEPSLLPLPSLFDPGADRGTRLF